MYQYNCIIHRIIDGDTVDVDIDLGFYNWMHEVRIRLDGVDTPESRTSDPIEKIFGKYAEKYVSEHLHIGERYIIETKLRGKDKYGRILGKFILPDKRVLNNLLVEEHLAVPYYGQNRDEVKEAHLTNREILINTGKIILPE